MEEITSEMAKVLCDGFMKSRKQVTEALQFQLTNYGEWDEPTHEDAATEIERTLPALSDAIKLMSEEAGAACYMAARMIRECVSLIIQQEALAHAHEPFLPDAA